jgi:hypothetical protein
MPSLVMRTRAGVAILAVIVQDDISRPLQYNHPLRRPGAVRTHVCGRPSPSRLVTVVRSSHARGSCYMRRGLLLVTPLEGTLRTHVGVATAFAHGICQAYIRHTSHARGSCHCRQSALRPRAGGRMGGKATRDPFESEQVHLVNGMSGLDRPVQRWGGGALECPRTSPRRHLGESPPSRPTVRRGFPPPVVSRGARRGAPVQIAPEERHRLWPRPEDGPLEPSCRSRTISTIG